jgi:hypothetical protein
LNAEQKASLNRSFEKEIFKWKNCLKWSEWSPNAKGILFSSHKFA